MTATTTLAQRIEELNAQSEVGNPATPLLNDVVTKLAIATALIDSKALRYDYGKVVWSLINALGVDRDFDIEPPETTPADERPIYLRIDEEDNGRVSVAIQHQLNRFKLLSMSVWQEDEALGDELIHVIDHFEEALGLPLMEELLVTPELFPNVDGGQLASDLSELLGL